MTRVVFMGTPAYAVPSLTGLVEAGYEVVLVVTQPDRPVGRGRRIAPPPVKEVARTLGLPVFQPERIRDEAALLRLEEARPEVIVTAAYGQLLPRRLLALPSHGALNLHASLLPRYRGGAPVQRAIMDGAPETGVTLMQMVPKMDAGPIVAQARTAIGPRETAGALLDRLAVLAKDLLLEALPAYLAGRITPVPQDETLATYAPVLTRDDERLDPALPADALFRRLRALLPEPGAYLALQGEGDPLKVWWAEPIDEAEIRRRPEDAAKPPGTLLFLTERGAVLRTGSGALELVEVQPPGKRRMSARAWLLGRRMWKVGDRLA
ncbi:methionyl-tRNA formyltransferase [Hydrogenibacillus sp. N12]|uniref:methionyl-tRNA formyltransferase n=1 Tax=Hydrogenibacillus sp. N12 TaxID=2866627 RepID=UPI001C7CEE93|nr:methionyl-tRNA formyltransferase [Hydrogenibacillus sp. N12]QZA32087.1 methionyl-tRNA formyltransferase [Hydrogenibacillus sp. N12]